MTLEKIGRYEIRRQIGKGDKAVVYVAYDPRVERNVAIKLFSSEFLTPDSFIMERVVQEAHMIAALEHPNIVPLYDFGVDKGQLYFVMRYMSGGSLSDILKEGPLPHHQIENILERIGLALDYAHSKGVIHRQLKPANIMFDQHGNAYLGGFGIGPLIYDMSTAAHMSPERVLGQEDLDPRSDVYALGVILFEMLTGKLPYQSDTARGMAYKHVNERVPRIRETNPDLPRKFDTLIRRAMAKEPKARFSSAGELIAALPSTSRDHVAEFLRIIVPLLVLFVAILFVHYCGSLNFSPQPAEEVTPITSPLTSTAHPPITPTLSITNSPTPSFADDTLLSLTTITSESIAAIAYELSIDKLGYGMVEISLPISITVGKSDFVRLEITPHGELASLQTAVSPITITVSSSEMEQPIFYVFTDEILIYSIMIAELTGPANSVEIDIQSDTRKRIRPGTTVAWTWTVTPKVAGRLPLILRISIPSVIDNNQEELTELLKDIPFYLQVATPILPTAVPSLTPTITPTPTPTPRFTEIASQSLAQDVVPLIVGLLTIMAAIIGAYFASPLVVERWKSRNKGEKKPDGSSLFSSLRADAAQAKIKDTNDINQLKAWLVDEQNNQTPRTTVMNALRERIEKLEPRESKI
jgi:serine/threonine protein kinase